MFFERVTKYTHLDNNRGGEERKGRVYGSLKGGTLRRGELASTVNSG